MNGVVPSFTQKIVSVSGGIVSLHKVPSNLVNEYPHPPPDAFEGQNKFHRTPFAGAGVGVGVAGAGVGVGVGVGAGGGGEPQGPLFNKNPAPPPVGVCEAHISSPNSTVTPCI